MENPRARASGLEPQRRLFTVALIKCHLTIQETSISRMKIPHGPCFATSSRRLKPINSIGDIV